MSEMPKKMAIRGLIVGGAVALGLATAAHRCDESKPREAVQESEPASPEPAARPTPAPPRARPPAPAAPTAAAPSPSPSAPSAPLGEAQLMVKLRSIKESNPASAIELARDGNKRFPDSPDAPERTSILIHALASQGASSEARGEAEQMVNHLPDSDWVRDIERFTGAHRHRNIRVNDAGELEYY